MRTLHAVRSALAGEAFLWCKRSRSENFASCPLKQLLLSTVVTFTVRKHFHLRFTGRCAPVQSGAPQVQAGPKIVGFGLCCMDYLAQIATYPEPDAKLRTERLEVSLWGSLDFVVVQLASFWTSLAFLPC